MNDIYVLNEDDFKQEGVIDVYESFIWTDRYSSCGDFEIYTCISEEFVNLLKPDRVLWIEESEHQMMIGKIETISDLENGNYLLVSGESLESILKRRILWGEVVLNGNLQDCVKKILNENIISPTIANRKIPNFVFEESDDPEITELTYEGEYNGEDLYEVIVEICESKEIGFKVTLNEKNEFVFKLYNGIDRSYTQTKNPYVVFSPNFDNIVDSNYLNDITNYRNVTLVSGEYQEEREDSEGKKKTERIPKTVIVGDESSSGLKRREIFTDARSVSPTDDDGNIIPLGTFNDLLKTEGDKTLKENKIVKLFDGEVDATRMYQYGIDFFMGDVCQLEQEYIAESRVRVIEFIYSNDKTGIKKYPTFEVLDEEEEVS